MLYFSLIAPLILTQQIKFSRGTKKMRAPMMQLETPAASAFWPKVTQGTNQEMMPGEYY